MSWANLTFAQHHKPYAQVVREVRKLHANINLSFFYESMRTNAVGFSIWRVAMFDYLCLQIIPASPCSDSPSWIRQEIPLYQLLKDCLLDTSLVCRRLLIKLTWCFRSFYISNLRHPDRQKCTGKMLLELCLVHTESEEQNLRGITLNGLNWLNVRLRHLSEGGVGIYGFGYLNRMVFRFWCWLLFAKFLLSLVVFGFCQKYWWIFGFVSDVVFGFLLSLRSHRLNRSRKATKRKVNSGCSG